MFGCGTALFFNLGLILAFFASYKNRINLIKFVFLVILLVVTQI
jgi:hypothetical protein